MASHATARPRLVRRLAARRGLAAVVARHGTGMWSPDASALTVVTALLLLVGLVMSFSASFVDAAETGDPFGIFRRQLVWALVGVPIFAVAARTDHGVWRRLSWPMIVLALAGLGLVLVPEVGMSAYGSTRWLSFGPLQVQPSELAKLATLLWLADVLERKRPAGGQLHSVAHLLVPALPLLAVTAVLVLLQPDLGTAILLGLIVFLVLWVEGLPAKVFVTAVALAGVTATLLAVAAPYRLARITGWLDPEADPLGNGYQLLQSLYALGSGGLLGLGLGSSRGKWNFVPNPETDFIFAIIGEELGLVGALFVLGLFGALLVVGVRVARTVADGFGRTVAFGVTGWLTGQALVNVGTVTGLLPITGVPLPLVSVGGSSLVSTLLALGILVSIAARADEPLTTDVSGVGRRQPEAAVGGRRSPKS